MTPLRLIVGFALILDWSSAFAGGNDGGAGNDPCDGGPLETRSVLRCRDGDRRCDMDGACDGTCFVKSCLVYPENPASCLVTSRFCPRSGAYGVVDGAHGPWLIPVGEKRTFRYHATIVGAVCKRARRRCVPPNPPPCSVTFAGDVSASFACQARLVALAPDRLVPQQYQILANERDGPLSLSILVDGTGVPAAGTFTAELPDRAVRSIFIRRPDGIFVRADNADPPRLGSLEATLALTQVGASRTQYHEPHGTFDASAVGFPGDGGALVPFTVHAEF